MTTQLVLVANAGEGSISVFRFDGTALERLSVASGLTGCSNFVVDTDRDFVYAAVKGSPAGIVTLRLDRESGELTQVSRRDTPRGGLNYVALTKNGSALLGAAYSANYGLIAPVDDGEVGEPTAVVEHLHLHSVAPSSDGRFAYFVSLGDDLVGQYEITDDLELEPLDPVGAAAPAGSGPRHIVLNGAETDAYVITEFSGEVLRFARDQATGILSLVDAASFADALQGLQRGTLGANPLEPRSIWGADVHWGADEQFLWTSERTTSTLAPLKVSEDGSLEDARAFTVTQQQPRGFGMSPDGHFLVAAGEGSTQVSLYEVHGNHLTELQQVETGSGANWVRWV
ncbi:6-phosphogluconolactonase [Pseudoclavibacter sp. JAI123]|uniref:lactonase family protein n=1 Tax=Pseudoclavibacter sp. JAI123 TaxID=2723065 RepID=UPI0015C92A0A|nr:beta-propeller fold lactonase family protein [Pseudoclavibacter sp. JAI123]NYF12299.1 6-phosphogluconolactonase [Pseudoclavibacter sp. JAI123]